MRIVFDISYIQKRRAGIGRYSEEILRALLAAGTQHTYVLHGWSYSIDTDAVSQFIHPNVHVDAKRIPGVIKRTYWNKVRYPPLEHLIRDFDIFHSCDPLLPPTKRKTIATVYDVAYKLFPHFFRRHVVRWDPFVRRSLKTANIIIVPSKSTRSDVMEIFKISEDKVKLIQPPVDPIFTDTGDEGSDLAVFKKHRIDFPYILFVGTIEPRKNIITLIKAFELFRYKITGDLHLVLAGKRGWLCEPIIEALMRSPVAGKIHSINYIPDTELAAVYRRAEFFVYPSFYEGYGFPVVEAMASGKPVITSNTSSLKELGGSAAKLINPHSIEELCDALCMLAGHSSLREDLSRRSLQRAGELSTHTSAQEILTIYDSLM